MIRLNKYLAQHGLGSRRKCDKLIQSGRVAVNGEVMSTLGFPINEKEDQVTCDGKSLSKFIELVYIILNKPLGYVTTLDDEFGRKKVIDLIQISQRIFPVGRLDKDTEGLLLLTNDGDLSYRLTHPKFHVEKVYWVKIDKTITLNDIKKIESGLMLEDGKTSPCEISPNGSNQSNKIFKVYLYEGKKRQIRRMFMALGYSVLQLKRIQFANLTLKNLSIGKWRFLTQKEVEDLKRLSSTSTTEVYKTK